jgi:hypothetical protein
MLSSQTTRVIFLILVTSEEICEKLWEKKYTFVSLQNEPLKLKVSQKKK